MRAFASVLPLVRDEDAELLKQLGSKDLAEVPGTLARVDALRDEFTQKIDAIRADRYGDGGSVQIFKVRPGGHRLPGPA